MLAGNLAVAHSRLGNIHDQLRWSERGLSFKSEEHTGFDLQQLQFCRARALALLGRTNEALAAMAEGREVTRSGSLPYLDQSLHLRTGDVLLLLGRQGEALAAGSKGVTGAHAFLRWRPIAGPFSRWVARSAAAGLLSTDEAYHQFERLLAEEAKLDLMDQVELINARTWLAHATGSPNQVLHDQLVQRLGLLPAGAINELSAMGMLNC